MCDVACPSATTCVASPPGSPTLAADGSVEFGTSPHYTAVSTSAIKQVTNCTISSLGPPPVCGGPAPVGCGGWACRDASGNLTNILDSDEAFEGAIDLAQLGFTGCISTFIPHTRSSGAGGFSATLKDFAIIPFSTCDFTLTKTPSVTAICNGSSTSVTYTYVIKNTGGTPLSGTLKDD